MNTNSKNLVILFALTLFGIGFTTSCETNNGTAEVDEAQDTLVKEEVADVNGADNMEMEADTVGMTTEEKQVYQELITLEDSLENTIQRMENKLQTATDAVSEETRKEYTEMLATLKQKEAEVENQLEKLEEDAEKDWEEFKKETKQIANDIEQWMEENL